MGRRESSLGRSTLVGDVGFGAPLNTNTISGNGTLGTGTLGGIFAYESGTIFVNNATISNNTGPGVNAYHGGVIELRGTTAVTVPASGSTPGASVGFGSLLGMRGPASIVSATSDGIQISDMSAFRMPTGNANTIQGNGPGAHGINCFNDNQLTASAVTVVGDLSNVTGSAGPTIGCNVFP